MGKIMFSSGRKTELLSGMTAAQCETDEHKGKSGGETLPAGRVPQASCITRSLVLWAWGMQGPRAEAAVGDAEWWKKPLSDHTSCQDSQPSGSSGS